MPVNLTPNMGLPVPAVGTEPGPTYATDVNNCFTFLDQHNHSSGTGVQINPSGININSAFTLNGNMLTNVGSITLVPTTTTPVNTTYESAAGDLTYINSAALNIQVTKATGVPVSP